MMKSSMTNAAFTPNAAQMFFVSKLHTKLIQSREWLRVSGNSSLVTFLNSCKKLVAKAFKLWDAVDKSENVGEKNIESVSGHPGLYDTWY